MVGERGDERVPGRTRSDGRQISVVPEEAVSTPLPEVTSFDHGVGLLSHAGEDFLLSPLANRRALKAQRVLLQGTDLVSWGAEASSMRGRGAWRRAKVTRRTTPPAGERAGAAIGRLGGRRKVGRGASSKSVMLARHVPNDFVDFLPTSTI